MTIAVSESVPIYSGDPTVKIDAVHSIEKGDAANVSRMCFGVHTGTHVDAPNHFIEGRRRIDQLDLEKLIGKCRVVWIADSVTEIGPEHIGELAGVERILFKQKIPRFGTSPKKAFVPILHTFRQKPLAFWPAMV